MNNTRDALIEAIDASALDLYTRYVERLHSEDATIDDLRKAVDQVLKAKGIGQSEKADTRVVVDIVFENGSITTAAPPQLELKPDVTDAIVKEVKESLPPPESVDSIDHTPVEPPELDDLLDDLVPITSTVN